jgi:Na+/melibiose symporter-like transporter
MVPQHLLHTDVQERADFSMMEKDECTVDAPLDLSCEQGSLPSLRSNPLIEQHDSDRPSIITSSITATKSAPTKLCRLLSISPAIIAFIALCLSIFLVALDTVLIPTALPSISQDFHMSDSLYAWTGSSYLLANAASVPFWGKLSDVFGRKPVIFIANTIFLVGSVVCAVSTDATILIVGRSLQGLGGGGVVVLVHVCVSDMFTIR